MQAMQQFQQPMPQAQQDPRAIVREEMMAMQTATELQQFQTAKDGQGNSLYPYYEDIKMDMARILEAGLAPDLKTAYDRAIRMNDGLWQAEQDARQNVTTQTQLQDKAKAVAKAKANTISVRSATPTGADKSAKPTGTRATVAAAVEAMMGEGGRV